MLLKACLAPGQIFISMSNPKSFPYFSTYFAVSGSANPIIYIYKYIEYINEYNVY